MASKWIPKYLKNQRKIKEISKRGDNEWSLHQIDDALRKIDQLNKGVDTTLQAADFSRQEMQNIMTNKDNFSPEMWEFIHIRLKILENKLKKAAGKDVKTEEPNESKKNQKSQKRRTKNLASKKKWIQM